MLCQGLLPGMVTREKHEEYEVVLTSLREIQVSKDNSLFS